MDKKAYTILQGFLLLVFTVAAIALALYYVPAEDTKIDVTDPRATDQKVIADDPLLGIDGKPIKEGELLLDASPSPSPSPSESPSAVDSDGGIYSREGGCAEIWSGVECSGSLQMRRIDSCSSTGKLKEYYITNSLPRIVYESCDPKFPFTMHGDDSSSWISCGAENGGSCDRVNELGSQDVCNGFHYTSGSCMPDIATCKDQSEHNSAKCTCYNTYQGSIDSDGGAVPLTAGCLTIYQQTAEKEPTELCAGDSVNYGDYCSQNRQTLYEYQGASSCHGECGNSEPSAQPIICMAECQSRGYIGGSCFENIGSPTCDDGTVIAAAACSCY